MTPAEELRIRADEGEAIAALLRECDESRASDLVAARLGGYRDAMALLGVPAEPDAEAEEPPQDAPAPAPQAADAAAEPASPPAAAPAGKRQLSAAELEARRRNAEKMRAALAAKRAAAAPPPAAPHGKPGTWTAERVALLERLWAEGETPRYMLERLNADPGPPIASESAVLAKARELVLPPRPELRGKPLQDALSDVPADELAEARKMMANGEIGARGLAEWFGWEIKRAQAVAEAIRAELGDAPQTRDAAA